MKNTCFAKLVITCTEQYSTLSTRIPYRNSHPSLSRRGKTQWFLRKLILEKFLEKFKFTK